MRFPDEKLRAVMTNLQAHRLDVSLYASIAGGQVPIRIEGGRASRTNSAQVGSLATQQLVNALGTCEFLAVSDPQETIYLPPQRVVVQQSEKVRRSRILPFMQKTVMRDVVTDGEQRSRMEPDMGHDVTTGTTGPFSRITYELGILQVGGKEWANGSARHFVFEGSAPTEAAHALIESEDPLAIRELVTGIREHVLTKAEDAGILTADRIPPAPYDELPNDWTIALCDLGAYTYVRPRIMPQNQITAVRVLQ